MTRLRVAWVVKAWETGGVERLVIDLAPALRAHVDIVPVAAFPQPDDLVRALTEAELNPNALVGGVRWPRDLARFVHDHDIDLVHTHGPYVGALTRVALPRCVPLVHTEHSVWSSHRLPTRILNRLTFSRNDAVTAVSEEVAREMPRARVVPNGIDIAMVCKDAAAGTDLVTPTSPLFVCVGHLRRRKGVDVLLTAAPLICNQMPHARGVIVGNGEDAAELRALQREQAPNVELIGQRSDARAITARADVFVVPSRIEGMPLALLEAMALSRPIVATRVGSIPELLTDEVDALLVPPEDPHALAGAIVRLLDDCDLADALGAAARRRVERTAGIDTIAQAYAAVYDDALALRRPRI
jgi:glycosyltransferase involved in cell wall biosynthesis